MIRGHKSVDVARASGARLSKQSARPSLLNVVRVTQAVRGMFVPAVMVSLLALAAVAGSATPALADGLTWTSRSAAADNQWSSVAYGDGLWVAIAPSGTGNRVMTSEDGIDWTPQASAHDSAWQSVAYGQDGNGDGLWVAVANAGFYKVMTSPDGINWTVQNTPSGASDVQWVSVAFGQDENGDGLWAAVSRTRRTMTSTNGVDWTENTSVPSQQWESVVHGQDRNGNGLWVAVTSTIEGSSTNQVMTSTDGLNWTDHPDATTAREFWSSVAYGQDGNGDALWVAVSSSNLVMTSPDGTTWTSRTPAANLNWRDVAYGNGLWVAVSADGTGNRVMTSPDGITWTLRDSAADNSWSSVAYGNGLWVAVAASGTNRVMTSGATFVPAAAAVPSPAPPTISCGPLPPVVGESVTCRVAGGDAGIDILWRAAYNPVFAEAGVTLDASGSGQFSFVVPAAALNEVVTVELVEWLAPVSMGVAGGPVPASVPAGGEPRPLAPFLLPVLFVLAGGLVVVRGSRSASCALRLL